MSGEVYLGLFQIERIVAQNWHVNPRTRADYCSWVIRAVDDGRHPHPDDRTIEVKTGQLMSPHSFKRAWLRAFDEIIVNMPTPRRWQRHVDRELIELTARLQVHRPTLELERAFVDLECNPGSRWARERLERLLAERLPIERLTDLNRGTDR